MASKASKQTTRARSLAAIHAGRRALRWDVDTYRAYLQQLVGKDSASTCSDAELSRILDGMRERGFQRKEGAAPSAPRERATQLDKARALWTTLGEMGELRTQGDAAFCAYVERMTRKSRPEWCNPKELARVIEGLKAWVKRASEARTPGEARPIE